MAASAKEIGGLPLRGSGIFTHQGIGIQMLAKSDLG